MSKLRELGYRAGSRIYESRQNHPARQLLGRIVGSALGMTTPTDELEARYASAYRRDVTAMRQTSDGGNLTDPDEALLARNLLRRWNPDLLETRRKTIRAGKEPRGHTAQDILFLTGHARAHEDLSNKE